MNTILSNTPIYHSQTSFIQTNSFQSQCHNPMPPEIQERIKGKSWNEDCPVPMKDLAYIQVSHWNFQNQCVIGELICHKNLALEIIEIFKELFAVKYPIEQMRLIDDYNAEDEVSMQNNNSSALCSRAITGRPGVYSKHSYGGAFDLNPFFNPYVKGDLILPKEGQAYLDRSLNHPAMIKEGYPCYLAFIKRGYTWGGHFPHCTDYHHFEKRPEIFLDLQD